MRVLNRRSFLKHLAFATTAAMIAPAAVAKLAADSPLELPSMEMAFVTYVEIAPLRLAPVDGDSALCGGEEALRYHTRIVTRAEFKRLFPGKQATRYIHR